MPIIVSDTDLKALKKRRWIQRIVSIIVTVGLLSLGPFIATWNDNPKPMSHDEWQQGMTQLVGSCCQGNGSPIISGTSDNNGKAPWVKYYLGNLGGQNKVEDGKASLVYTVLRIDVPSTGRDYSRDQYEEKEYYEQGLSVGDTVTHGPVTIEILAIHDATFDRNDAVTIQVTIDETRLGQAP